MFAAAGILFVLMGALAFGTSPSDEVERAVFFVGGLLLIALNIAVLEIKAAIRDHKSA